jgi:hypothetical protein
VQQTAPVAASIRLCSREDRASRWVALIVQAAQLLQIPVAKDWPPQINFDYVSGSVRILSPPQFAVFAAAMRFPTARD